MAFNNHGYDDARFEIEVSESFHCIICFQVLNNPVMCKNQHYYCLVCIKKHLETSECCPMCRDYLTVDTLIQTPRIVTDYLSELNIRCDFHHRGCLEMVKLKNLERHVASCGFSPVQCSNDGCDAVVSLRDKIHHQSEICEFRKSKCHDCGQLKHEVEELRMQMMVQQNQMKEEMKGIKEQVKNEVKREMRNLSIQMLARQDQIKQEIQQDIVRQCSSVRDVVKIVAENIMYNTAKKLKNTSDEIKKEIQERMKCCIQSAEVDEEQKEERITTPSPLPAFLLPNQTEETKPPIVTPNRPIQSFEKPTFVPVTTKRAEATLQSLEPPPQKRQKHAIQIFDDELQQFDQSRNKTGETVPSFAITPPNIPFHSFVIPSQNGQNQPIQSFGIPLHHQTPPYTPKQPRMHFETIQLPTAEGTMPLFRTPQPNTLIQSQQSETIRSPNVEETIPSFGTMSRY